MLSKRPATPEAYIELIQQVVFEVGDLRAAIEYDSDGMADSFQFIDELERHVKTLYNSLEDGSYEFSDEDLPFMNLVRHQDLVNLPFRDLLTIINDTHRNGLDVQS